MSDFRTDWRNYVTPLLSETGVLPETSIDLSGKTLGAHHILNSISCCDARRAKNSTRGTIDAFTMRGLARSTAKGSKFFSARRRTGRICFGKREGNQRRLME